LKRARGLVEQSVQQGGEIHQIRGEEACNQSRKIRRLLERTVQTVELAVADWPERTVQPVERDLPTDWKKLFNLLSGIRRLIGKSRSPVE
jgi:hypothetical protein